MTRVLVVHHDHDVADIEVDELRRAGYEVDQCAGPIGNDACPVLKGEPCWQVHDADVLVYDMWASGDGREELIDDIREIHPDKPVVLTSGGLVLDWVQEEGPHSVTPVPGTPTPSGLVSAVESALLTGPAAPPAREKSSAADSHAPRW